MSVTRIVGWKGVEQKTLRMRNGDQSLGYPKLSAFRVRKVPLGRTTRKHRSRKADNPTKLIEAQKRDKFQLKGDKTLKIKAKPTKYMPFGTGDD